MRLGEAPPTAGLLPNWSDLAGRKRDPAFEHELALFIGAPTVLLTSSGTAALVLAMQWLAERSPRRTVIVAAYTCPLVVLAAARAGLRVLPCDTVPGGFDLDLAHLARLLSPDTLAVIATHYGGALTDVARLRESLDACAPGTPIIEDAAQAFGARWRGRSVGLTGDIGVFSFGVGKGFTIFQGGCLVSRSVATMVGLSGLSARLANPAPWAEFRASAQLCGYHAFYNPLGLRLVYGLPRRRWLRRGDEIKAVGDEFPDKIELNRVGAWRQRVGARALERLPAHLAATRARFADLALRFATIEGVSVHVPLPDASPTGLFLFVTLPTAGRCRRVLDRLWSSRLGVTKLFARALGDYEYLARKLQPSDTPNARDLAARTLTITTSPWLGEPDVERIQAILRTSV